MICQFIHGPMDGEFKEVDRYATITYVPYQTDHPSIFEIHEYYRANNQFYWYRMFISKNIPKVLPFYYNATSVEFPYFAVEFGPTRNQYNQINYDQHRRDLAKFLVQLEILMIKYGVSVDTEDACYECQGTPVFFKGNATSVWSNVNLDWKISYE